MFILDSLSLNGTATKLMKQKTRFPSTTSFSTSAFKSQENQTVRNLIPMITAIATTTTSNETCDMTTNKCKQVQQNLQHLQSQQKNKAVERFVIQKSPSSSPSSHKIKEIFIKNNNENLNDEQAMTAIENNTTINDNTMPREMHEEEEEKIEAEQQKPLPNNTMNINGNENICDGEWNRVPAISNRHHNCNNCNVSNTTDINASATTTTTTTTSAFHTLTALNNDNTEQNNAQRRRIETKMLTNCIQNNVDLNTFAAAYSKHECDSCSCPPFSICINKAASKGMLISSPPSFASLQQTKKSYSLNNAGDYCLNATDNNNVDDNDDNVYESGSGGGGVVGCLCHNSSNKNYNNCYSNKSNNNTNNLISSSTNSFLMVECSPSTCENERKQQTRNTIQNGYKNTGNSATANAATANSAAAETTIESNSFINQEIAMAECLSIWGEQKYCSARCAGESSKDPVGSLLEHNDALSVVSPVDSVLENFEKFLNSVKLENRNLKPTVAECHDLIDLSDGPTDFTHVEKGENIMFA